jgi:hypothetical protein
MPATRHTADNLISLFTSSATPHDTGQRRGRRARSGGATEGRPGGPATARRHQPGLPAICGWRRGVRTRDPPRLGRRSSTVEHTAAAIDRGRLWYAVGLHQTGRVDQELDAFYRHPWWDSADEARRLDLTAATARLLIDGRAPGHNWRGWSARSAPIRTPPPCPTASTASTARSRRAAYTIICPLCSKTSRSREVRLPGVSEEDARAVLTIEANEQSHRAWITSRVRRGRRGRRSAASRTLRPASTASSAAAAAPLAGSTGNARRAADDGNGR